MLETKHFVAARAIEMNMVFGMCNIRAIVFAACKTGNTIGTYDFMYNSRFFKIVECAVKRNTVYLAKSGFDFSVRQCLLRIAEFFQHLESYRCSFQAFFAYEFCGIHYSKDKK